MNGCGVEVSSLADTGANGYLFLNQSLAEFLVKAVGAKIGRLPFKVPIRGYNGSVRSFAKQFIRLHLTIDGRLIKNCPLIVMDLGDQDLIIGIKWLRRFKIQLDPCYSRFRWPSDYPPNPTWERILKIPYTSGKLQRENHDFQADANRRDRVIAQDVK